MNSKKIIAKFNHLFVTNPPWATYGLITLSLAVYALLIWQGVPISQASLRRYGALVPQTVANGEIWRLFCANFVHVESTHLLCNLVSLLFVGAFMERYLGIFRLLTVYLMSGVGAMILVACLYPIMGQNNFIVAGSSAAIFGLIGALFVWLFKQKNHRPGSKIKWHRGFLVILLIIQFGYDFWTPEISLLGHLSGLAIGWLITSRWLEPARLIP